MLSQVYWMDKPVPKVYITAVPQKKVLKILSLV